MSEKLSRFILQRFISDKDGTVGGIFYDKPLDVQTPICYTLERPWLDNKPDNKSTPENDSSCIPANDYFIKWTKSPSFTARNKKKLGDKFDDKKDSVWTFEILDVKNRSGDRIHAANCIDELLGCIAPATFIPFPPPKGGIKHTNGKVYKYYASGSSDALKKLESILPKEGCILSIKDAPKVCNAENQWMISLLTKSSLNVGVSEKKIAIA